MSSSCKPLIADFGFSMELLQMTDRTLLYSTKAIRWMAPELLYCISSYEGQSKYTKGTDSWAFGMVAYVILCPIVKFDVVLMILYPGAIQWKIPVLQLRIRHRRDPGNHCGWVSAEANQQNSSQPSRYTVEDVCGLLEARFRQPPHSRGTSSLSFAESSNQNWYVSMCLQAIHPYLILESF